MSASEREVVRAQIAEIESTNPRKRKKPTHANESPMEVDEKDGSRRPPSKNIMVPTKRYITSQDKKQKTGSSLANEAATHTKMLLSEKIAKSTVARLV